MPNNTSVNGSKGSGNIVIIRVADSGLIDNATEIVDGRETPARPDHPFVEAIARSAGLWFGDRT
jgi:hypothetical protein